MLWSTLGLGMGGVLATHLLSAEAIANIHMPNPRELLGTYNGGVLGTQMSCT